MKTKGKNWFNHLKQFIADRREKNPIVNRDSLSPEPEMQCRIIGGSLISWLREYGPELIQERAILARIKNWEEDPFIVFTSDQPGLVAASEILEDGPATIAFLYSDEFSEFLKNHPDLEYGWHVHTWSFFTPVDEDTTVNVENYALGDEESLWLHKIGTMCGELFGRGNDHLWKWDGQELVLLEECIDQWVS